MPVTGGMFLAVIGNNTRHNNAYVIDILPIINIITLSVIQIRDFERTPENIARSALNKNKKTGGAG